MATNRLAFSVNRCLDRFQENRQQRKPLNPLCISFFPVPSVFILSDRSQLSRRRSAGRPVSLSSAVNEISFRGASPDKTTTTLLPDLRKRPPKGIWSALKLGSSPRILDSAVRVYASNGVEQQQRIGHPSPLGNPGMASPAANWLSHLQASGVSPFQGLFQSARVNGSGC
ncbi:uncharacterized protein LOC103705009 isoform X2 [Phoenix dactylifera]|uniref:Uncharacterized protein LOC103705009 isoform X2 n=1 Tax=Phoenix dactylifera TaxID=42345 RepID=A0A8B9ANA9_PHODC|nr:uncharacterized protein LOC103705009 isoform X2 [Phoenix dactylifera]